MIRYRVNGKVIKVRPEHEQQFLEKYPNAIRVEGNQQGVAQDATATLETTASDSLLGITSSDSQQKKEDKGIVTTLASFAKSLVDVGSGLSSYTEGLELAAKEFIDETFLNKKELTDKERSVERARIKAERFVSATFGGPKLSSLYYKPIVDKLSDQIPNFDTSITQDFQNGDYAKAAKRTVDGFAGSASSFILAAIPGGLPILAASVAGNKYEEEIKENADKDTATLIANATGSGIIEGTFEYFTRGILKKVGLIKTGQVDVAREFIENSSKNVLRKLNLAGWSMTKEGSSEAATEFTSAIFDKVTLGKDIDYRQLAYRMSDAFIIGGFSGGVFESVGAITNKTSKTQAESALMREGLKAQVNEKQSIIARLTDDLTNASPEEKSLINDQIKLEAEAVKNIRNKNSIELGLLKGDDLKQYSDNLNKINSSKTAFVEAKTESGKELAKNKYEELTKANNEIINQAIKTESERSVETIKEQVKVSGLEGTVKQATSQEISEMDLGDKVDSKDAAGEFGFIRQFEDGSFEIIVNKDKPAIGVAAHEFLHAVLRNTLKGDTKVQQDLSNALTDYVDTLEGDQTALKERLSAYKGDVNVGEETITIMSESILNGDLKFNEGFFTKIGDIVRRFFQSNGITSIKLDTGRDVYNFIKDYNESIRTGKINKAIVKVAKEGAKGVLVKDAEAVKRDEIKMSRDAKIPIDKLGKVDGDGQDMTEAGVGNFLYQAEADEVVRKIKEEGYLDNLIAAKYKVRPVPDAFVDDVLAELTPHIKAFKPETNDSLFGWIQSQLANKAGNVYNKIYKDKGPARTVDVDATTTEGAPVVQIEADPDIEMQRIDEMGLNDEQVQERSKFRRALKLNDDMVNKVIETVKKTLGTKLPNVNTKQFKQALAKSFKTDLKKPMQDLMGKGKSYDNFLEQFMPVIHKFLPVEVLVQIERNLKPEQRIFTSSRRITKPIEVDRLISEGRLPKDTNRLSGPLLNTKLPYPGNESILAFFRGTNSEEVLGYKKGASTYGTRKDVLAERTITEVAFDAVSTVIQDPKVSSKIEDLNIAGIDKVENELAMVAKQIDRDPTIKFSRSAIGVDKSNVKPFLLKYNEVLNRINSNETLVTDKKGLKKIIKEVYDDILDNIEMNNVVNKIIRYSTDFEQQKVKRKDVVDVDIKLTDYILEATEKDVVDKSVMQLLSKLLPSGYKNAAAFFNDKARVNKARSAFGSFAQDLRDSGLSKNEILRLLDTQYKGMYASSSKISAGQFSVEFIDGAYVVVEGDGKVGTHRGQVFENVADFYRVAGYPNYKQELKNVNTKTFAETSKAAVADKNYDGRLKQAKEARQAVLKVMDYYFGKIKNGELDYGDLLMLAKMFLSNMNSPMKRAANLAYIAEGVEGINPKDMGRLTEYEHIIPTSVMVLKLFSAYVKDGKASENIFDGYEVAIIPKSMDKVLIKNGLRDFLPITYKEGDPNWKRYFNKQTLGENNLVPLVNIKTGEVIGADFVKASNILTSGEINQKGAQLVGRVDMKYSKSKGMSTFDFDETLIIGGKNFVVATDPKTGDQVKISSEEWPIKGPDYADAGYEFDFSDFAKVRGGKEGPLLQKMKNQIAKYGNKNVFVLTARQQDSAEPIKQWLKTQGIDIPLRNITGLGRSEGEAKGEWMLQKFAEGYNDMYFVDDALPNVEAVKKVLDNLDIKSKVVQAKIKFSKTASKEFNDMLERSKGVETSLEFSDIDARLRGAKRDRFKIRFFVPPSAEDLKGLVYAFLGKGKQGDQDLAWFRDNLFNPFAKGTRELNSLRQRMSEDYTALKKSYPQVVSSLNNKVSNTEFTVDNAIRAYLWNMAGFEVPGLSDTQKQLLVDHVAKNPQLVAFADVLSNITRTEEGYVKPKDYWITQNIGSDLHTVAETINREKFLAEWQENADLIFSKENLNKIEAIYGSNFREALEDMLYRMKTGSNRPSGRTSTENKFLNWINGAVSAVMFFNMRSAGLQSLSMVNFLNFEDNNIFKASRAFANQKQFWSDFTYLFNSDMLKQRRAGLKIDVSASEITDAFAQGKNKTEAVIKYLLEKGFIPTKMMDSFAIALGGSTFYRNRVNKLVKEGMSETEAQEQAFLDFQEIAEETQQSSRPDLISMQQASSLGRLILAWANTPMQYTRLTKKALSDIVNGRGDLKANMSRILYYGAVQNIIFGTLQTGLAFLMFGDDEEDKDRDKKEQRVLNGVLDTLLRGVGVYGALVSTAKNALIAAHEELGKGFGKKDYSKIMQQLINLSPPIGSKVRKIIGSIKSYDFNKDIIDQMDHGINNPAWNIFTGVVEGVTNAPLDRIRAKMVNVREAFVGDHEMWQRVALVMGWNKWDLGVKDAEIEEARDKAKEQKKKDKKQGVKKTKTWRCRAIKKDGTRCKNEVTTFRNQKCYAHK